MIDRGLSVAGVHQLVEVAGAHVDVVKLGWGTALATGNLPAKLAAYAGHGIPVVLGGTLTELAVAHGRVERFVAWLRELGLGHVEVSDGIAPMEPEVKLGLIARLAPEFVVFSEVGSKDAEQVTAPYRWVAQIEAELEAGATRVIAEARESGSAGIFRADGEVRMGLIDEIAHSIDVGRLVFEAPRKDQQAWFVRRFGPDVNLGNIAPEDALPLETLRLGLRSDTVPQ